MTRKNQIFIMKTLKKMNLNVAVNELSRKELKSIMAGSSSGQLLRCCREFVANSCMPTCGTSCGAGYYAVYC